MIRENEIEETEYEVACAKIWSLKKRIEDPKIMQELSLFSDAVLNLADISDIKSVVQKPRFNVSESRISLSLPSIEVRFTYLGKEYKAEAQADIDGTVGYSMFIRGEWSNLLDYKVKTLAQALVGILKALEPKESEDEE